ncbi:GNAT family N-acetyltransferase [Mesorhizobium sp. B3-1-3]|nr:GNAT family N-acetyltransferase [Mesorhizobium sp. B3-1-8]TPI70597.1 GNAT family N-acetyltransferase [Mesorhizobium sp. B3-1-3]
MNRIEIALVDPGTPAITAMFDELNAYMSALYPAESNHFASVETLRQPNVRFFGAKLNGEFVGCGGIVMEGKEYSEVKRIFVSNATRGLGIGRKLIEALAEASLKEGITLMRLETGISQPEALALFAVCGFTRCGSFGDYPADDPYSVFMDRVL